MADHLPVPLDGEPERDFLMRAMDDAVAVRLFSSEKLRLAVLKGQFLKSSSHGGQSGGGRRITASALPDGGEVTAEGRAIQAFMADPDMVARYPDQWHRHARALENLQTERREIEAARTCQPWEEE